MKLNARQYWLVAGLAMGVISTSTLGQVAPPPTEPAKEKVQAGEPVKAVAPAQPQARPQSQPANVTARQPGSSGNTNVQNLPTSTPYPKLIVKDDDGKIIRLTELPDILALRSNPTIGPMSVEKIMPVVYGRRARFERLVIDSLDLYWMVTDGRLETANLNDIKNMAQVAEMIKPLVGRTTMSQELQNRSILTRTQGGMNSYIVNEYKQAVTAEIQFESDDALSEVMRFVLQDSIHETKQAYSAMIAELSGKVGDLVEKTGLTSSAAMEVAKLQRSLNEDPESQRAELAELDAAMRKLSVEEGIELLTAMRNERKNPDFSPAIQEIDVMHSRKVDITGKGSMEGTIKYPDGRVINTIEARERHAEKLRKEKEALEKQKAGNTEADD